PGIIALHSAMHGENMKTSREITSGTVDRKCRATMEQFYRFLATVAADLAMTTGAYGGVYIAGGIVPDHIDQIQASTFRERFEDKNRYRHYMQAIPTYVITDPTPGLTGLTAYIVEHKGDGAVPPAPAPPARCQRSSTGAASAFSRALSMSSLCCIAAASTFFAFSTWSIIGSNTPCSAGVSVTAGSVVSLQPARHSTTVTRYSVFIISSPPL